MSDWIRDKSVRMTSAQVISVIPRVDDPEMKVYTVDTLDALIDIYMELTNPEIGEFIVDIQVVHWDEVDDNE